MKRSNSRSTTRHKKSRNQQNQYFIFIELSICNSVLPLLSRNKKEKLVIKLANEGKTTREIAKIVHISLKDIGKIINRETGDAEVLSKEEKEKEKQKRLKSLSPYAQAFQMFKDKRSLEYLLPFFIHLEIIFQFINTPFI